LESLNPRGVKERRLLENLKKIRNHIRLKKGHGKMKSGKGLDESRSDLNISRDIISNKNHSEVTSQVEETVEKKPIKKEIDPEY